MNSGLISGPVQAAKNGRWRSWELTNSVRSLDVVNDVTSTPETITRIVPIPAYVTAVRVSATAPGHYLNSDVSASGAACKNALFPMTSGRRFLVSLDENGIWFGVLLNAQETANQVGQNQFDVGVRLSGAGGQSSLTAYRRGAVLVNISSTTVPVLRPFFGGSLVTGFTAVTAINTPNPLDPQIRAISSIGQQPSMLFGGPLPSGGQAPTPLPGAAFSVSDPFTGQCSTAYIRVEWME